MLDPWVSLVPLQEEQVLGAAQPSTVAVGTTCQKNAQDQPKKPSEHKDLVCGVYSKVQGSDRMTKE